MATGAILVKTCALGHHGISNAPALRHFAPSGLTILCAVTPSCPCLNHYVEHVCAAVRVCGIDDTPHSFPLLPPPSLHLPMPPPSPPPFLAPPSLPPFFPPSSPPLPSLPVTSFRAACCGYGQLTSSLRSLDWLRHRAQPDKGPCPANSWQSTFRSTPIYNWW